jgi:hypothetical protein
VALPFESAPAIHARVLARLLARIRAAEVRAEPFCHAYFDELFPDDVYAALLAHLPPAGRYWTGPHDPRACPGVRAFFHLTAAGARRFPPCRGLWRGVAAALTDPRLKRCLFARLAPDLAHRFGVPEAAAPDLAGHPRPTLYREIEGYELPPHPDSLEKVVTMHLYLPADLSQLHLGTALYRREGRGDRHDGFVKVRQFEFRPNSGYAFAVSDSPSRQSWHGRERLPAGSGVRNTLLNTYYVRPRPGYSGYLDAGAEA